MTGELDIGGEGDLRGVDLENALASLDIGRVDHDPAVEATRTQQRGIEDIGPVGGGDEDHAVVGLEAVHLHQQLVEGLFAFVVSAAEAGAAVAADGVDLVDEDDAGALFLPCSKRSRTRDAPTPTNISTKSEPEIEKNGTSASPATALREQGLAGSRRAHEQHALGNLAAEPLELLRVLEEIDDLLELFLGLGNTGDILEGDLLLLGREQLGLGLAEGHGLGAAGLHLPEKDKPETDQDQQRRPRQQRGQHSTVGGFLDLDDHVVLAQILDEIVIAGVVGEVVVARLRSVLFSRCSGLDVDLLALDQDLLGPCRRRPGRGSPRTGSRELVVE